MPKTCRDRLIMPNDMFTCERKAGHKGRHRESFSGWDGKRFVAIMKWRRS